MTTSISALKQDIFRITDKLQKDYPAIYEHLMETPVFENETGYTVNSLEYALYLETIDAQLIQCEMVVPPKE